MRRRDRDWRSLAWQSLGGALAVFAGLVALTALRLDRALVVTSIGATAFILFLRPNSAMASPRCVIVGHLIGFASGTITALPATRSPWATAGLQALAVGFSLLAMAATRAQHPPAAGTALSVAISGFSWQIGAVVLITVIVLVLAQRLAIRSLSDIE